MADSKLTELTDLASPASTDILYVVADPTGSPLSRKATIAHVVAAAVGAAHNHTAAAGDGGVLTNDAHDGYGDYTEIAAPAAPAANVARIYAADDGGTTKLYYKRSDNTIIEIGSTGGGHVIEDEGTPVTQRSNLNFTGAGVSVADVGGKTVVTIAGGTGGVVSTTGTVTSVGDSATHVELLASNGSRVGASIYNQSTANLYVKTGDDASASDYTVMLQENDYWEVPFGYTGLLTGIWASDAGGYARVTEYE